MAANTIADLDVTPANNGDILGQSTSGTSAVSTIDNMIRALAGLLARFYADLGGALTVGGTANAITLTSNSTYQAHETGLLVMFKAASANTGAATLNLDSLGAKAIRRPGDSALSANDIVAGGIYLIRYDAAYNSAAGAWVLLNGAIPTASTTVAGVIEQAVASEYWSKASGNLALTPTAAWDSAVPVDFGNTTGTKTLDLATFLGAKLAATGNVTFGATSNIQKGRTGVVEFTHSGGARTLAFNSTYHETAGGSGITLSNASGAKDILVYYVQDNGKLFWMLPGKAVA